MHRLLLLVSVLLFTTTSLPARVQTNPVPAQGDFTIRSFKFDSGEVLPELKLHYRTLGTPRRDATGVIRNAVLVMHGTGGSGGGLFRISLPACSSSPDNCSMRRSTSSYCLTP